MSKYLVAGLTAASMGALVLFGGNDVIHACGRFDGAPDPGSLSGVHRRPFDRYSGAGMLDWRESDKPPRPSSKGAFMAKKRGVTRSGHVVLSKSLDPWIVGFFGECNYHFLKTPIPMESPKGVASLNGIATTLLPDVSFCLNEAVAIERIGGSCAGCSAWVKEVRPFGEGWASLECNIPSGVMGFTTITYGPSKFLGTIHRTLVKEHPSYNDSDKADGEAKRGSGGFTGTLQAPAGSDAERLCGYIAQFVAPRLLGVALPHIEKFRAEELE